MPLDANTLSAHGSAEMERKLVTILFADIASSSALVSGRDPEDADLLLRPVLDLFSAAVVRYGGLVAQVMGDGILAVFGAPAALENHALRACLAAEDVIRAIHTGPGRGLHVAVRIGVASGEVVLQHVRNAACHDLRTVGECVHLAAKLQQRAEPNSVLLSRETIVLARGQVTARPAGHLRLAADAAEKPIFHLIEAKAGRPAACGTVAGSSVPFVGRRAEIATLRHAWGQAQSGRGSCVLVRGAAGIGKSALAAAFLSDLAAEESVCLEWPQSELRRLGEPDSLERVAGSLVMAMARRGGGAEHLLEVVERGAGQLARLAVESLIGQSPGDALWRGLNADQKLAVAADGLAGGLAELSRDEPVAVVVEDAHWADAAMARFLSALLPLLKGTRIGLVVTRRAEDRGGWTPDAEAMALTLAPFSADQTAEFLDRWLGDAPGADELKERLAERSQGVPLYLEESLRTLEAGGAIAGRRGAFRVVDASRAILLPPSIRGVIAARIDTLDEAPRRVLLRAAAIGDVFDAGLLRSLDPVPADALPATLDHLEERGFVRRLRVLPNLEYGFVHALVRETAYRTLTLGERRALHARLFGAIRRRRAADLPNRLALMAHHAFLAERWSAACVYGHAAGRLAETRSRLVEATEHYERVLGALDHLAPNRKNRIRAIDLCIDIPRVALPRGIPAENGLLARAAALAEACGDPARLAQALSMEASFLWVAGDLEAAAGLCRKALAALAGNGPVEMRAPIVTRLGGILTDHGRLAEGAAVLEEAIRLTADPTGQSFPTAGDARAAARCYLTRLLAERGDADAARRMAALAIDAARDRHHPFTELLARVHVAWAAAVLGEFALAAAQVTEAEALAETIRSPLWQPLILGLGGYAQGMDRDAGAGLARLDQALAALAASPQHNRVHMHHVTLFRAEVLLRSGRIEEARISARQAREGFLALGQEAFAAKAAVTLAEADGATPALLAEAEAIARSEGMRRVEWRAGRLRSLTAVCA
jgi:class 3 adenylate cyclase/tetratricopeptide (TPR) repeat protein